MVAKQIEVENQKAAYQDLWGECQKCQGMWTMDVLCSNADCPIFYKRRKVKKEMESKVKQFERLESMRIEDL